MAAAASWVCAECTFINEAAAASVCEICQSKRKKPASKPPPPSAAGGGAGQHQTGIPHDDGKWPKLLRHIEPLPAMCTTRGTDLLSAGQACRLVRPQAKAPELGGVKSSKGQTMRQVDRHPSSLRAHTHTHPHTHTPSPVALSPSTPQGTLPFGRASSNGIGGPASKRQRTLAQINSIIRVVRGGSVLCTSVFL